MTNPDLIWKLVEKLLEAEKQKKEKKIDDQIKQNKD